ncbi:MAG: hypothetical protein NSGCLCUN01_02809 [uncultured Clostridium sp.]
MSKIEQLENEKEKIEIRDTFQLYCKVMEEATELENEVDALAKRIEEKAQLIAGCLMDRNDTFGEALKELEELSELANGNLIKYLRENAIEILEMTQAIIFEKMEQAKYRNIKEYTEGKEIKNTDGDTTAKVNEDGITVKGILKINTEQEQEMEAINYLPAIFTEGSFTPEFIEQITKEVIKKMKEDHISFGKIQLPSEQIPIDVNKDTSNVDNKTSNSEDIEVNKERDSEAFSITVNIETPEIIQEIVNTYIESLKVMSKAMKEFEEKANCKIEVLKGKVNSLKIENNKLKEGSKYQKRCY